MMLNSPSRTAVFNTATQQLLSLRTPLMAYGAWLYMVFVPANMSVATAHRLCCTTDVMSSAGTYKLPRMSCASSARDCAATCVVLQLRTM